MICSNGLSEARKSASEKKETHKCAQMQHQQKEWNKNKTFWQFKHFGQKNGKKKGRIHCLSPTEKKATMTVLKLTLSILLLSVSPTSSSHKQKIKHGIAGNGNTYAMSQRTLQKRHKMQTLIQSIVPTPILVPLCHILAWSNEKPRCSVVAQAACSQKTHG